MEHPDLTFSWPRNPSSAAALSGPLLFSLLVHSLAFTLLQVVPKEKASAPKREHEIELLSEDIPEHRALLAAVEAESPVGALSHQLFTAEDLLAQASHPVSFQNPALPLEPALWKPGAGSLLLHLSAKLSAAPTPPVPPRVSQIEWSNVSKERIQSVPSLPSCPRGRLLENPSFLLGFAEDGRVRYVLRQRSSGDDAADLLAQDALRKVELTPSKIGTEWIFVTFVWGQPSD